MPPLQEDTHIEGILELDRVRMDFVRFGSVSVLLFERWIQRDIHRLFLFGGKLWGTQWTGPRLAVELPSSERGRRWWIPPYLDICIADSLLVGCIRNDQIASEVGVEVPHEGLYVRHDRLSCA